MVIPIDGVMTSQKPLMLKDFLELDANSDYWDGFCSAPRRPDFPTVRHLLDSELSIPRLARSRSKNTLTRISHVIHSISLFSSSSSSSRHRWRKREGHRSKETADVDGRPSIHLRSPAVSSCSSSSDYHETPSSDFTVSSSASSNFAATIADVSECQAASPPPDAGDRRSDKEEQKDRDMKCSKREEEQLSPVSLMDFPEEEEEEEAIVSPRFHQTLDSIERTRQQLLEKIRRFESLAELDLDLFSSSSEEEEVPDGGGKCAARDMLCQLKARVSNGEQEWWSMEKVPLGFFAEGQASLSCYDGSCLRERWRKDVEMVCRQETAGEGMMSAAMEWIGGGRRVEDVAAAEMRGRRWMWLGWEEEEEEVVVGVEMGVLGWLMEELVLDLVSLY